LEQWTDILDKRIIRSQASIEYSIESTFKSSPNINNLSQIIKEANLALNDNIIAVGNFVKETFNNLPHSIFLEIIK
jgi:alcohol dehydrogenase class IV